MSTVDRYRWGVRVLLAALICAVLAGSGLDSTASAQSPDMDYDADDDGLIEVTSQAQLKAISWDLDGNGAANESANEANYSAAFPGAVLRMGCPATGCTGYELAAFISLSGIWSPIGDEDDPFTATFDGNAPSYTIRNLFITRTTNYVGLFGVTGATSAIRNVKLTSVNVTGNDYVGALAGRNRGQMSNCETTGRVKGRWRVGGLTGSSGGAITASASSVTVTSTSTSTGGLAGGLVGESKATINDSSASGSVTAPAWVGGLVGRNGNEASITGSTASGAVTATRTSGSSLAGGLVGQNLAAPIQNSHARGNVTGSQDAVGGLVGSNYDENAWTGSATPRNAIIGSTARGTVTTTGNFVGGLVGWNNGTISDSAARNPSVSGVSWVGGLVGSNNEQQADGSNTIDRSTATASVTGTDSGSSLNVGGLVGWNNGPVRDSYAGGAVQGWSQKGGLIGTNAAGGRVTDSRADGAVGSSTTAGNTTGGLVGLNKGAVAGSVATGAVSGSAASTALGGLVGRNSGPISSSAATGVVSGGHQVGGLVGYGAYAGSVTESWAGGAVSAISLPDVSLSGTLVGGLVGWNDGAVGASFATGNVTGADGAGGLIGRNLGMLIATHATGNVTASGSPFCRANVACPEGVGGLIGYALERTIASTLTMPFTYRASSVEASYSTGSVSGDSTHILGSLAGNAERNTTMPSDSASFTNSYWDTGTSGQTLGVGSDDEDKNGAIDGTETPTAGVTGQTTTALQAPTGYTGIFANWNVTIPGVTARTGGPWDFGAATDYPVLRGLGASPSFPAGKATRSVAEERTADTPIGSPLTATDVDGDALSYKLVGADAIFFSINSMTGQLSTKAILDYENPGDADRDNAYEFMIQARDGTSVAFQTVAVTVTDAIENNFPPNILGDSPVGFAENGTGPIHTYRALDPDGATSTFTWSLAGNDAGAFIISGGGELTFATPPDFEARADADRDNMYEVTIQANDGGRTGERDVLVTVMDVDEPADISFVASGGVTVNDNALTVDENHDGALATFRARDPESKPGLTYQWSVDTADYFVIRAGVLSFVSVPNYEIPAGGVNVYDITVTALDSDGETGSIALTVTVEDVDEPADISFVETGGVTVNDNALTVDENYDGALATFTASDPENAVGLTYVWGLEGTRRTAFEISEIGGDGVLSFVSIPDYDLLGAGNNVYNIAVTALDSDRKKGSITLTVTVEDVDESPTISGDAARSIEEDGATFVGTYTATDPESGTLAWLPLAGSDAEEFEFTSSNGRLAFKEAPDFEDPGRAADNVYDVTLGVADGSHTPMFEVLVTVTNKEEPGTLTLPPTRPQEEADYTATLSDPDGVVSTTWTWERSMSRGGPWVLVTGAVDDTATTTSVYTPVTDDVDYYLRATAAYTDALGNKSLVAVSTNSVLAAPVNNNPPAFSETNQTRSIAENAGANATVGSPVTATDNDPGQMVRYELEQVAPDLFTIDGGTGQIRVKTQGALDHELRPMPIVTVKALDNANALATAQVTIEVTDVNEPPDAVVDAPDRLDEDTEITIDVLANDSDPEDELSALLLTVFNTGPNAPRNGTVTVNEPENVGDNRTITYEPNANYHGADTFTYRVGDTGSPSLSSTASVSVWIDPVNDAPTFASSTTTRSVSETARAGDDVGERVTATDIDAGDSLAYSLSGADMSSFEIDSFGQITVAAGVTFDMVMKPTYAVTVEARDESGAPASIDVTITVTAGPVVVPPPTGGGGGGGGGFGGGGGGGGGGPSPSVIDFEWNVTRDIDDLDSGHDKPSGLWSDGVTLWVLENGDGTDDAVYAYDLATGERVEDREFELDEANRAPRGVWSDGVTMWVSDSGRNRLFAHDLATGERVPERDIALADRNRDARGIWSGDETMWVLDGGKDSLFAYDLVSGDLLAEYELASTNGDPHGVWSDGVTVWVSDHGAKRLFAYRLPARPEAPAAEDAERQVLDRISDEEFTELSKASNNSPRGIWSDGDVMYVVDESDAKVYTYNMPNAIDARLSSLTLSGVDIGEFDRSHEEYEGTPDEGVTVTTVEAEALQRRTSVDIDPPDADGAAEGHQVALEDLTAITVTVTSADGSRTKTYRVRLGPEEAADPAPEEVAESAQEEVDEPVASCLRGDIAAGFSLVLYGGGGVEDLVACAEGRNVTALYVLDGGEYVSYIVGAPGFVNGDFRALFTDGVPALTPLVARSDGPPSPDPAGDAPRTADATQPWPECLRGDVAEGFSLVVYEGGSVGDLETCARGRGVTAMYTLHEGAYVSYILGAPELVNRVFAGLFAEGVPSVTPLVVKGDAP